ncbi:MAG: NUDIX domain-containing protein [Lachnospiraceae bacterium]|nr:NUDIX domain-containing protein [Lachnospiraceae bacterium]
MKELFTIDAKNYNPLGRRIVRPSVRGICVKDGKVLLIYAPKYDYYKFAGGGLNEGESHEDALMREMREETGYIVKRETIKPYGHVLRIQKSFDDENASFVQDNFYYWCEVEEDRVQTEMDDYEADEGFTAVWEDPLKTSYYNDCHDHGGRKSYMIERDSKVMLLVYDEIRKSKGDYKYSSFAMKMWNDAVKSAGIFEESLK